jgi:hypothetical protein
MKLQRCLASSALGRPQAQMKGRTSGRLPRMTGSKERGEVNRAQKLPDSIAVLSFGTKDKPLEPPEQAS